MPDTSQLRNGSPAFMSRKAVGSCSWSKSAATSGGVPSSTSASASGIGRPCASATPHRQWATMKSSAGSPQQTNSAAHSGQTSSWRASPDFSRARFSRALMLPTVRPPLLLALKRLLKLLHARLQLLLLLGLERHVYQARVHAQRLDRHGRHLRLQLARKQPLAYGGVLVPQGPEFGDRAPPAAAPAALRGTLLALRCLGGIVA